MLEFSRNVFVTENQTSDEVVLRCPAGGSLPIERTWSFAGLPLEASRWDSKEGSLVVDKRAEGEYSCTVRNAHGRDSVVYSLHLLRTPEAPQLSVTPTSTSSIRLTWVKPYHHHPTSSRMAILDYVVFYKPAQQASAGTDPLEKVVDGSEEGTVLDGLLCGTQYELQIQARNSIGWGPKSPVLRAMTRGAGPSPMPAAESDDQLIGFSASLPGTVFLHLDHWPTGGCRITYLQIEKRGPLVHGSSSEPDDGSWNALASNLNPDEQPMLKISDFLLDGVYQVRLTAASDSGVQSVSYTVRRTSRKNRKFLRNLLKRA